MPWEDVDTLRLRARALQSGSIEKGQGLFVENRIAGTEAISETDPGQIGNERQRNGLIKRHEDSFGREPCCTDRGRGADLGRSPLQRRAQRGHPTSLS